MAAEFTHHEVFNQDLASILMLTKLKEESPEDYEKIIEGITEVSDDVHNAMFGSAEEEESEEKSDEETVDTTKENESYY